MFAICVSLLHQVVYSKDRNRGGRLLRVMRPSEAFPCALSDPKQARKQASKLLCTTKVDPALATLKPQGLREVQLQRVHR
jgi:hypothetical protein